MISQYEKDLVSVIIPTYKRSDMLTRAIDSVLNQTYGYLELYLVNDNEPDDEFTDELKKKVEKYTEDPRFHFIIQEKHINGAVARNVGIREARGEYIAFLDDDDWWKPEKIEKQVAVLKELSEDWGGVSCKIEKYDGIQLIAKSRKYRDGKIYKDILLLLSDVATGTLLLRHAALDEIGYFDEKLTRHQDLQLLVDFTYKYKLKEVDEYLHCCDVSDAQNRPNPEKLINAKKSFFHSVKPVLNTLSICDQRNIYVMHRLEVGYVLLRYNRKKEGLKACCAIFSSPIVFYYILRKICVKLSEKDITYKTIREIKKRSALL